MTVLFLCNSLIMGEEWEDYPESAYEKYLFQRFFFDHLFQSCKTVLFNFHTFN